MNLLEKEQWERVAGTLLTEEEVDTIEGLVFDLAEALHVKPSLVYNGIDLAQKQPPPRQAKPMSFPPKLTAVEQEWAALYHQNGDVILHFLHWWLTQDLHAEKVTLRRAISDRYGDRVMAEVEYHPADLIQKAAKAIYGD